MLRLLCRCAHEYLKEGSVHAGTGFPARLDEVRDKTGRDLDPSEVCRTPVPDFAAFQIHGKDSNELVVAHVQVAQKRLVECLRGPRLEGCRCESLIVWEGELESERCHRRFRLVINCVIGDDVADPRINHDRGPRLNVRALRHVRVVEKRLT